MLQWIIQIIKLIFAPFSPKIPPPSPQPDPPAEAVPPKEEEKLDIDKWVKDAAFISSTFEGKGGDYANVTGNFDGAYLTCGLLGLTWKYSNQITLIKQFIDEHGLKKLFEYMPHTGSSYYEAYKSGEVDGGNIVAGWSSGSKVREPYKSELTAFWASPEMIKLQDKYYAKNMGTFALKKCLETQEYFNLQTAKFEHYAYWWDQAVLNGTGNTIPFEKAEKIKVQEVMDWIKDVGGYNKNSNRMNYSIWSKQLVKASSDQVHMFKLAYLRSLKSRPEFQGTTMMRRGSLALGIGYVNEEARKFDWLKS